ncbi:MAG: hypothetical protein ACJ79M_04325 [Myxococcales bacterium]
MGQITALSATERTSVPIDFSSDPITAIVTGPDGNEISIPTAAGSPRGTFTIPDVPNGNYILFDGFTEYLVTSTSSPDFGFLVSGRLQRTRLTKPTFLDVNMTGLAPWNNDFVEFFVTEEHDWDSAVQRFFAPPPKIGDTSVSFRYDLRNARSFGTASAIRAQGDHGFFAQRSNSRTPSGIQYFALTRIAQLAPFDLADGASASVSAQMVDVSTSNALTIDYRGTQWDALMADGNPAGTLRTAFLFVQALPGSVADGFFGAAPALTVLNSSFTASDAVIGPMNYGSPTDTALAGGWEILFQTGLSKDVTPVLPGTTSSFALFSGAAWTTTPATAQAAPLTPPITMPVNAGVIPANSSEKIPFFNADPAAANQIVSGIGLTPTIAWSPSTIGQPASGEPPVYVLTVSELSASAGSTIPGVSITIRTPDLSFRLPSGILQSGHTYVFTLLANVSTAPGVPLQLATSLFREGGADIAIAGTVSSIFTP